MFFYIHHTTDRTIDPTFSMLGERERNVLFNDALNTFCLRLFCVRHMVLRTILIVRKETRCRHIGYSYRLTARVLLYAPSHRQDNTYHGLCYTSRADARRQTYSDLEFEVIYRTVATAKCDLKPNVISVRF